MDEKHLVELCKKGRAKAQKEVYRLYNPLLRAVCLRYASNSDDAEDILQDAFIKIFLQIDKFNWVGPGSLSAWMRRVMINTAINYYRKSKYKTHDVEINDNMMLVDEEGDSNIIEILIDSGFKNEDLLGFLQKLSESNRIVFNLYVLEDYKHKEIAEMLGIDERVSRIRLLRARKELQNLIVNVYKKELKLNSTLYG